MSLRTVDIICVFYLYFYAFVVGTGAMYDAWLTLTGRRMVTDMLLDYGNKHPWFILASCIFVAWTSSAFSVAYLVHIWISRNA